MSLDQTAALEQIKTVFTRFGATPDRPVPPYNENEFGTWLSTSFEGIASAFLALIERLAPASPYLERARAAAAAARGDELERARGIFGVAASLYADIEAGYVQTLSELLHAEVFDDFLQMAEELLSKNYAAPAAVLAGSVLEDTVKKLVVKAGEEPAKGFEQMTHQLVKGTAISSVVRSQIAGYYAIRTAAAHGRHEDVDAKDVRRMIDGVRDFVIKYPA